MENTKQQAQPQLGGQRTLTVSSLLRQWGAAHQKNECVDVLPIQSLYFRRAESGNGSDGPIWQCFGRGGGEKSGDFGWRQNADAIRYFLDSRSRKDGIGPRPAAIFRELKQRDQAATECVPRDRPEIQRAQPILNFDRRNVGNLSFSEIFFKLTEAIL
jgi:hypothetical protein